MKQVAVLGLGDFGLSLTEHLTSHGVSVLAVDMRRSRADLISCDRVDRLWPTCECEANRRGSGRVPTG